MEGPTLNALLEAADEGVIVFDGDGKCRSAGRRIGELFGVDTRTLVGGPEGDVLQLLASACEEPDVFLQIVRAEGGEGAEVELKRPRVRIARWRSMPVHDDKNHRIGWLGIARDVTRERSAERRAQQLLQRLESIVAIDALTQLPNKRRFVEELEREHGRAARAWDSYAILRIDVDGLDAINKETGHPRGDEVLEQVAARLRDGRREYDLLARLEADEFIVLLPGADVHAARIVAQRMSSAVSKSPIEIGEPRNVSVSIGAAVWVPPSGETGVDVMRRAGEALEHAKKKGAGEIGIDGEGATKSEKPPAVAR
jgi:diguanylate cyclase (GGDEF)-like protein/PAS domain S-box-containing protein